MPFLILVFVLIYIELTLFIKAAAEIGALATVAMVFVTAIVGISIIMRQGMKTMVKAQTKAHSGQTPAKEIIEGILLGVAAVLLLVPGFFTDTLGFILLTPIRSKVAETALGRWIVKSPMSRYTPGRDKVIEGEYRNMDE